MWCWFLWLWLFMLRRRGFLLSSVNKMIKVLGHFSYILSNILSNIPSNIPSNISSSALFVRSRYKCYCSQLRNHSVLGLLLARAVVIYPKNGALHNSRSRVFWRYHTRGGTLHTRRLSTAAISKQAKIAENSPPCECSLRVDGHKPCTYMHIASTPEWVNQYGLGYQARVILG